MAQGFICDRCGAAIFVGEQATLSVVLEGPHGDITTLDNDELGSIDLCPRCTSAVADIIVNRVITRTTSPEAWGGTRKEVSHEEEPDSGRSATRRGTEDA